MRHRYPKVITITGAIAGLLLLSACASTPQPPTGALQAAQSSITQAEQARVADYASPELKDARDKLSAARDATQQQHMLVAQRLAEEAQVDAELAIAKTAEIKAKAVNDDMRKSLDSLQQEMQRNN